MKVPPKTPVVTSLPGSWNHLRDLLTDFGLLDYVCKKLFKVLDHSHRVYNGDSALPESLFQRRVEIGEIKCPLSFHALASVLQDSLWIVATDEYEKQVKELFDLWRDGINVWEHDNVQDELELDEMDMNSFVKEVLDETQLKKRMNGVGCYLFLKKFADKKNSKSKKDNFDLETSIFVTRTIHADSRSSFNTDELLFAALDSDIAKIRQLEYIALPDPESSDDDEREQSNKKLEKQKKKLTDEEKREELRRLRAERKKERLAKERELRKKGIKKSKKKRGQINIQESEKEKKEREERERKEEAKQKFEEKWLGYTSDISEIVDTAIRPIIREIYAIFNKAALLDGCKRFGRMRCTTFLSMVDEMRIPPFVNLTGKAKALFKSQQRTRETSFWQCQSCWNMNQPTNLSCTDCNKDRPPPDPYIEESLRAAIWAKPSVASIHAKIKDDEQLIKAIETQKLADEEVEKAKLSLKDAKAGLSDAYDNHANSLSSGKAEAIFAASECVKRTQEKLEKAKLKLIKTEKVLLKANKEVRNHEKRLKAKADSDASKMHKDSIRNFAISVLRERCKKKLLDECATDVDSDECTLSRYEFIYAILWCGKSLYKDRMGIDFKNAVKRFLSMHFSLVVAAEKKRAESLEPLQYAGKLIADDWRRSIFYTKAIDWFVRIHYQKLLLLFMFLASRESGNVSLNVKNVNHTRLSLSSWETFVKVDGGFTHVSTVEISRDSLKRMKIRGKTEHLLCRYIFQESQMFELDSTLSDRQNSLSFIDFVEAFIRLASAEAVLSKSTVKERRMEWERPLLLRVNEIWQKHIKKLV
eukprot:g3312.t1